MRGITTVTLYSIRRDQLQYCQKCIVQLILLILRRFSLQLANLLDVTAENAIFQVSRRCNGGVVNNYSSQKLVLFFVTG